MTKQKMKFITYLPILILACIITTAVADASTVTVHFYNDGTEPAEFKFYQLEYGEEVRVTMGRIDPSDVSRLTLTVKNNELWYLIWAKNGEVDTSGDFEMSISPGDYVIKAYPERLECENCDIIKDTYLVTGGPFGAYPQIYFVFLPVGKK